MERSFGVPVLEAGNAARTVNDATTGQIRDWILNGTLRPGERLHQDQLAATLGVSRMPVREAIRQLAAEGLVQLFPHRGAFVSSLDPDEIRELYEVRAVLEGLAVVHAAPCLTESDLAGLRELLARLQAAEATRADEDTVELDRRFHDRLMAPAAMPYLRDLIEQARRRSEAFRRAHTYVIPGHSAQSNAEHAAIVEAAARGDADMAMVLIQAHLRNAADHLISYFAGRIEGKAAPCQSG